jgi:hypothetical protein
VLIFRNRLGHDETSRGLAEKISPRTLLWSSSRGAVLPEMPPQPGEGLFASAGPPARPTTGVHLSPSRIWHAEAAQRPNLWIRGPTATSVSNAHQGGRRWLRARLPFQTKPSEIFGGR